MSGDLKIGELAGRAGVTVKAIRFYERKRVLPPAKRAANRYRLYDDDAVGMLYFVKQATGLGLTLVEIKEIIAIRRGGRPPCPTCIASCATRPLGLIASSRIFSGSALLSDRA